MGIDSQSKGMTRYFYEYLFYRTVERTKELSGKPLMISQAKQLRATMEGKLRARGTSMEDPKLGVSATLNAIEETMIENVPGYSPRFGDRTRHSQGYQILASEFLGMAGIPNERGVTAGPAGPRLPISPYDPRFSSRSTVKQGGSALTFVAEDTIEQVAGSVANIERATGQEMVFHRLTERDGAQQLTEAGPAITLEDASGMSELMGRMSERDYAEVRQWVIDGGRTEDGRYDRSQYMSEQGLARATAILDELADQGVDYKVVRDQNPGQIKAVIDGSKVSVRLTDRRSDEAYIGRVHENGVSTYYSTDHKAPGQNTTTRYEPSPAEVVDLMRYAQGLEIQRNDGKGPVGEPRTRTQRLWNPSAGRAMETRVNDVYVSGSSLVAVAGRTKFGKDTAHVLIRRDASSRTASTRFFRDADEAETYLRDAVGSARSRVSAELDVEGLIQQAEEHGELARTGEYEPELSPDADIAAIQRGYWDVLIGNRDTLLRPDEGVVAPEDQAEVVGEFPLAERLEDLSYHGSTSQEKVRGHQGALLDSMIGTYEPHIGISDRIRAREQGLSPDELTPQRFDPVRVAQYMQSSHGTWRNNDDIVTALRKVEIEPEQLRGSNFYNATVKSRMIKFDEFSAKSQADVEDPFLRRMLATTESSLRRNGVVPTQVRIDAAGVIDWTGERFTGTRKEATPISGQIGQVFAPGQHGAVTTQFAGGNNYMFVPGYEARVVAQKPGEDLSVEERTVLRGYEQIMSEQIQHQISSDVLTSRTEVGEPAGLNSVYRRLYDTRHEVDFMERSAEEGLSDSWRQAILETEGRRVRYSNALRDGSTINAEYQASKGRGESDPSNDNFFDPYILTGGRNMSIMTEHGDGYFDPMMTSGSINQGVTRYLVEGAQVGEDGRIAPSSKDDRTPLMKHPDAQQMRFDPFDRQQMSSSNLMQASAITGPTRTAMMTFGGWTADDPVVISQNFSQTHQIRGADGQMRDLIVGDKVSDLHGNKGVISLIVDPDMDPDQAREQGLEQEVAYFRENPGLDVVMSPFSAVSRFNGGTARELMGTKVEDLEEIRRIVEQGLDPLEVDPELADRVQGADLQHPPVDGGDYTASNAAIGDMRFIITHMAVDEKTKIYDDEALAQGRGRKASSQLAWALGSQGCEKIMAEAYGTNSGSIANLREMLVTMGLDMDPDGTLRVGSDDMAEGEQRQLFSMPPLQYNAKGSLNMVQMSREFGDLIGTRGGDLELPFPLQLPSGRQTPRATDSSWKLPVMSSHLRSGQDLDDGTSTAHDYTNHYRSVFEQACRYRFFQEKLQDDSLSPKDRREYESKSASAVSRAQGAFDLITTNLKNRRFSGKRNVFKEQVMANRLPNSATAVWTSDPRLAIDQVSMGPKMAESLGVQEDEHVLIWRDPMLRDAGVRYMRVAIDERLTGVAINPVMDKCFDGDFDGDAVAVVKLNTEAAKQEAMEKLSVPANLLELGQRGKDGLYPLAMQDSLDVKVAQHRRPELAEQFQELTERANDVHAEHLEGKIDWDDAMIENRVLVEELSGYYRDALSNEFGGATLRFDGVENHLQSVKEACIDTGAKGSMSKLKAYAEYLGAEMDDEGHAVDKGEPLVIRDYHEGVMYATAIKSFGTGVAGTFSQRGVKALRNEALKPVLELTYPVTQSVLQAKHDPEEARVKYENLMGPARELWRGRLLEKKVEQNGHVTWESVRDKNGGFVQADPETWKKQFMEVYTSSEGLNVSVNEDNVEAVAQALTDPVDKTIANIEDVKDERGSTMDRLAYGGDFSDLLAAASKNENIFDGSQNGHFAPFVVRANQKALSEYSAELEEKGFSAEVEAPELTPLVKKDTQVTGRARGSQRRSPLARATGERVPLQMRNELVSEVESSSDYHADAEDHQL